MPTANVFRVDAGVPRLLFSRDSRRLVGTVSVHDPQEPVPVGAMPVWDAATGRASAGQSTRSLEPAVLAAHPGLRWIATDTDEQGSPSGVVWRQLFLPVRVDYL